MRAGALDRRLTILRPLEEDDGLATVASEQAAWRTVWASREPLLDGERARQGGVLASATARFRVRWASGLATLNARDGLSCEGRSYDILGVKEIGRREGLEITAAERTTAD